LTRIIVTYARDEALSFYLEALRTAGWTSEEILAASPASVNGHDAAALLDGASGLLLTGGADIEPALYGETRAQGVELDHPSSERDRLECELLDEARSRGLPVLAICRGLQLLNARLGGTLWQDLKLQAGIAGHDFAVDAGWPRDHRAHRVEAAAGDHPMRAWADRFGGIEVNSRHHQAVREVAPDLVVTARSADGVVEAMSYRAPDWWARGVQWHPENLVETEAHLALFLDFRTATEDRR